MKKVLFLQLLAENGKAQFHGLYDENGIPVTVETECDNGGTVITILRDELTEEQKQNICDCCDDCADCPLHGECETEFEESEEDDA